MLRPRVMPCLLLDEGRLVKTVRFRHPAYVGDPVNAIKIYNEKEVDELIVLDICATPEDRRPDMKLISEITTECFMPLCYGGGVKDVDTIGRIFGIGVEKVALNTHAEARPTLVNEASRRFGSQSVVLSMDVKRPLIGRYMVYTRGGRRRTGRDPVEYAREMARRGAGEIMLTSIDRDGTWKGYDTHLIEMVTDAVDIPVIAVGGAGGTDDFTRAIEAGASAAATGSYVVYSGKDKGVLINFPSPSMLPGHLHESPTTRSDVW